MKKLVLCVFIALMCSNVSAKIDSSDANYNGVIKLGRKSLNKKSVRMIIKEILNNRKIDKLDIPNTIPIPLYDSIDPQKFKNLA